MPAPVWKTSDEDGYELVIPFLIDGGAHSAREREMFALGFEFGRLRELLRGPAGRRPISETVHRENEDRIRVMCGRSRRECTFEAIDDTWSRLLVARVR